MVESFIEHQDACNSGRARAEVAATAVAPPTLPLIRPSALRHPQLAPLPPLPELQLLPTSTAHLTTNTAASTTLSSSSTQEPHATKLQLSIGLITTNATTNNNNNNKAMSEQEEELRKAMDDKAAADAARERAQEEAAAAERALEDARRARQRARAELEKACALRDHAARMLAQVTCHACRQRSLTVAVSVTRAGEHGGSALALSSCESLRGGG